jgi:hypothetical protein
MQYAIVRLVWCCFHSCRGFCHELHELSPWKVSVTTFQPVILRINGGKLMEVLPTTSLSQTN